MTTYTLTEDFCGGYLIGYIVCSYEELEKALGEPNSVGGQNSTNDGDGKVAIEWSLKDEKGTCVRLYDWKMFVDVRLLPSYQWHVGGNDEKEVQRLAEHLSTVIGRELKWQASC